MFVNEIFEVEHEGQNKNFESQTFSPNISFKIKPDIIGHAA